MYCVRDEASRRARETRRNRKTSCLSERQSLRDSSRRGRNARAVFIVCRACSAAWRCKSSSQPDGGEVIAKRKGVAARRGLKEARSKSARRWTRTGFEGDRAGRAGNGSRSPYPSRALDVNPAVVRGRRRNLPREISRWSRNRD